MEWKNFIFLTTIITVIILINCSTVWTRCSTSVRAPINPLSKTKRLPFNKYAWMTTHNSFAMSGVKSGTGSKIMTITNQEDSITSQLKNGVRGLMLDMYDFNDDIWLCHGKCSQYRAFQPAVKVLKEVGAFLEEKPEEIVSIFIEDHVTSPNGLKKMFDNARLRKFWFPVHKMPKNGEDWPRVSQMIRRNHRLVVFTSIPNREVSEGIAYQWNYTVENQYGRGGMKPGSCSNRQESGPMDAKIKSLVVMNHFRTVADGKQSCEDNSTPLINMLQTCAEKAGNRWPNFIAVDYYKRGDGNEASDAVDKANGHLVCGSDNVAKCKARWFG